MPEDWQPSASLDIIRRRADLLKTIRRFMEERGIMEVETPILSHTGNPDPNLVSFTTRFHSPSSDKGTVLLLNTSPEFAMKRLLAAGSGPIFQISRVFRDEEAGSHHEPEFSMLEWYRPGFDHHGLMDEMAELLKQLGYDDCERQAYGEVFESCTGLNPHLADQRQLHDKALYYGLQGEGMDRRGLLDFLFSHAVAPALTGERPLFIYDFPACQAALARLRNANPPVAERFELLIDGLEIANGFHELRDAGEQARRFEEDNRIRRSRGLMEIPVDQYLIAALAHGLPDCAGVALGLDRLLMSLSGKGLLSEIMTFSHQRS